MVDRKKEKQLLHEPSVRQGAKETQESQVHPVLPCVGVELNPGLSAALRARHTILTITHHQGKQDHSLTCGLTSLPGRSISVLKASLV